MCSSDLTIEELDLFLAAKLEEYPEKYYNEEVLWYIFQDDFKDWTEEHFRLASIGLTSKLRSLLRQYGVWVPPNNRKGNLASSLFEAAQSDDILEWPDEEVLALYKAGKLNDTKSSLIQFKIKVIRGE